MALTYIKHHGKLNAPNEREAIRVNKETVRRALRSTYAKCAYCGIALNTIALGMMFLPAFLPHGWGNGLREVIILMSVFLVLRGYTPITFMASLLLQGYNKERRPVLLCALIMPAMTLIIYMGGIFVVNGADVVKVLAMQFAAYIVGAGVVRLCQWAIERSEKKTTKK